MGTDLFGIGTLRAGLASQMILYFIIAGSFFVLPLYLQTVLGLDALQSGIRMLPLSVALFLTALIGSRLATRYPPRTLIRLGIMVACLGLLLLIGAITRLTESGLSMVEWRPLIGALPPFSTLEWERIFALYRETSEYRLENAGMTLDAFKTIFWWEYIHRFWGRLIGLIGRRSSSSESASRRSAWGSRNC